MQNPAGFAPTLEIASRFPHSHRPDDCLTRSIQNQERSFPPPSPQASFRLILQLEKTFHKHSSVLICRHTCRRWHATCFSLTYAVVLKIKTSTDLAVTKFSHECSRTRRWMESPGASPVRLCPNSHTRHSSRYREVQSGQIEKQKFCLAVAAHVCQSQPGFAADRRAIAFRQLRAVQVEFTAHQLHPGMTARLHCEFQRFATVEQRSGHASVMSNK